MTRDDLHQVIYKCNDCGEEKRVDDISLASIEQTFIVLGWQNVPVPGMGDKVDYVVTCPRCNDEALEMERQQQADNDCFLADTGRW